MKNWFSKFLEQTSEQGRNAVRLALTFIVAGFLAALVFAYVAVQNRAWQGYVVVAAFLVFFAIQALVIRFAQRNQLNAAGVTLIAGVCFVVLAMISMMAGIGLGLSIALAVVIVEIAFEAFSGTRVARAIVAGFVYSVGMYLMDRFASWNRPAFPEVQYAIPTIAAATVLTIAFLVVRRFVQWRNLGLAQKLLVAFGTLFVFGLVIAASGLVGLNRVQNAYKNTLAGGVEIQNQADTLNNALLKARRREKDFLLRWKEEGFDNAYISYVVPHRDHVTEMKLTLDELSDLAPVLGRVQLPGYPQAQYAADIAVMNEEVLAYEQAFTQTVNLLQERGFVDTGLEGEFRVAVQAIEERVLNVDDQLTITMLQIRRREKDYLLRGDQEHVDNVNDLIVQLKSQVTSSDLLSPAEKAEIRTLADDYLLKFNTLVEKDREVTAAIEGFRVAAAAIQADTDRVAGVGQDLAVRDVRAAEASATQTFTLTGITVFIVLALSIALAVALSRQITRPVIQLTNTAQEIATGKFDVQAEVTTGDEIGALATTFNIMTDRLGQAFADVRRRAAELATVAEVSTATATILEVKNLLQEVVDLTKERFNLYHSHIYLLDEAGENLVLASGAGEPGRIMVSEGRFIPLSREQSLVARAAREQAGVTVNDVTQAPDFLPNPLLPNTRSELAVPMIVGGKVIGVFDVQSDVVGRFTDSDIQIQTTLAAQLATSVQNVRSFEQSKTQADFELLVNTIGQKIQRATTVEDTLQIAIRELGMALGATRVKANLQPNRQS